MERFCFVFDNIFTVKVLWNLISSLEHCFEIDIQVESPFFFLYFFFSFLFYLSFFLRFPFFSLLVLLSFFSFLFPFAHSFPVNQLHRSLLTIHNMLIACDNRYIWVCFECMWMCVCVRACLLVDRWKVFSVCVEVIVFFILLFIESTDRKRPKKRTEYAEW